MYHENCDINTFKPELTIVIFIHNKARIAVAICSGWGWLEVSEKFKKIVMYWYYSFMEIFFLKPTVVRKLGQFSEMWNDALMHREGLKD